MTEMYEFERFLEEYMEYGLGMGLLSNFWSVGLSIATYVLTGLALYTLAKRRGIQKAWLSWVPVLNCWILGSLSDQYRYVVKGEVKNKRKALLILNIITWAISVAMVVVAVGMLIGIAGAAMGGGINEDAMLEMVMGPVLGILGLCLPLMGVAIATAVIHYMALYDVYTSCTPQNNVVFLVLSILFSVTEPFFLFFTRNKDDGMPPRKQEPVYEAPQEPWSNTEYL